MVWRYRSLFLPFRLVCEDGGECNFEPNEICIWWLSLLSLLCCCLFNSICVWVESLLSDVTRVYFFLLGIFSRPKPQPPISAHYNTLGHLFEASQRKYSLLLLQKIDLWTDQTTESKIFRQSVVKNRGGAKCLWLNSSVCWLQSSDVDCGPVFWISRRSPWPVTPLMGYLLMNRWWEETNTVMVYWAPDNCLYCCSSHFVWTTVWWFGSNRATPGEKQPENIHFLC